MLLKFMPIGEHCTNIMYILYKVVLVYMNDIFGGTVILQSFFVHVEISSSLLMNLSIIKT